LEAEVAVSQQTCVICKTVFEVKSKFQVQRHGTEVAYVCTPEHLAILAKNQGKILCTVCQSPFSLAYAYQMAEIQGVRHYFCSPACREAGLKETLRKRKGPRKLAILNQKGGTGKTTTAVSIAAGLAEIGQKTLLIDLDAQSNVSVSLGVKPESSIYQLMTEGRFSPSSIVKVSENLEVIASNETLASAEIFLARMDAGRERVFSQKMEPITRGYDFVVLDCAPALSLLNQNALIFSDEVLVPVSCDYLSLFGVRQVVKTIKTINDILLHPIKLLGVLPTFYDMRNKIAREALKSLHDHFEEKVLPPIRANIRLKEAPSFRKTIFDYDPKSTGAGDYRRVVQWILGNKKATEK
jgi:chromosome partitioning protein